MKIKEFICSNRKIWLLFIYHRNKSGENTTMSTTPNNPTSKPDPMYAPERQPSRVSKRHLSHPPIQLDFLDLDELCNIFGINEYCSNLSEVKEPESNERKKPKRNEPVSKEVESKKC